MYEKSPVINPSEHLNVAENMAKEILSFNPKTQNEMVKHIYLIVKDSRNAIIREMEETLDNLKSTLEEL